MCIFADKRKQINTTNLMKVLILLIQILLYTSFVSAQDIIPFYSYKKASENLYADSIYNNGTFSNDDINTTFSNIEDLSFLQEVVAANKVVLMGETHYATHIYNLRNRILFALNTYDYFPLIILELPYSIVEYYNYYVHLDDDREADLFLANELSKMVYTEEDILFLNHIRRWNKTRKNKPISIGGTDLEFSYQTTIELILIPYLSQLGGANKTEVQSLIVSGKKLDEHFFSQVKLLSEQAGKENLTGKYPFMTVRYINNIVQNLHDTYNALNGDFFDSRQKSIIGKLTNDSYFGSTLKEQKVMLHGGGEHMKNKLTATDNPRFLSEGIYLNHTFPATKGKVYSIMAECLAYSYGEMKNRKLEDCVKQGNQYRDMIGKLEKIYEKQADAETPYFLYEKRNFFLEQIAIHYYLNESVSFTNLQLQEIARKSIFGDTDTQSFLEDRIKEGMWYNNYIFVPASKIVVARLKKQ
ncbi:hypothetical protein FACS1894155_04700 [Bacteroidia bacterium]|nr:hypothetical protein FACS1894155_04700 [Bacteroidia bacterium]